MPRKPWEPKPEEAHRFSEVFIDETSVNGHHYLVIGGIIVAKKYHPQFEAEVIAARGSELPALSADGTLREMKWTKVSPAKLEAYKRVIDTFFSFANKMPLSAGHIDFHCVVVDAQIKAGRMSEAGYNKEIAVLGQKLVREYRNGLFRLHLDFRTTNEPLKPIQDRMNHIGNKYMGKKDWPIRLLQFEDSKHFQTLQVADIILGALGFRLNGFDKLEGASKAKSELAAYFLKKARIADVFRDTKYRARVTIWHREKHWLKPMLKATRNPTP
jgi:uncharacterized protein DUF3800